MRAAAEAFLAAIGDLGAEAKLFDSELPPAEDRPPLYVVVFDQTPQHRTYSADARPLHRGLTFAVMHVGTSANEVRWLAERTESHLTRKRLTIGDRQTTPLRKISGQQITPATETNVPRYYTATDVWQCALDHA